LVLTTDDSYFYDSSTSELTFRLAGSKVPPTNKIFAGVATGSTKGVDDDYYKLSVYYEPRITDIFSINTKKDPLYFGILQFQSGSVKSINTDGKYDDWRSLNVFAQPARLLIGNRGDTYANFVQVFSGFIENDSTNWNDFSVRIQDPRKRLTNTVTGLILTQSVYPFLSDSNNNKPAPVAYGPNLNASTICLNEEATASEYTFLFIDTTYNNPTSVDAVYLDGVEVSPSSVDLNGGTFIIQSSALQDGFTNVTVDFTMPITNGVAIIKDLMEIKGATPYIDSLWDKTEVDAAELASRNTSLYIDDETDVKGAIERVAEDIDALFFAKDNGLYTIRIFDLNRTTSKKILQDEWISGPKISNNGSEFLTSAIVEFNNDLSKNTAQQIENLDYKDAAFDIYKTFKTRKFPSGLTSQVDALAKGATILQFSSNVADIVTRSVNMDDHLDLVIMDFVTASPKTRPAESETFETWEILGMNKSFQSNQIDLTLRFIKSTIPQEYEYNVLVEEAGNYIVTSTGATIALKKAV
jgi:hypothetical protein